MRKLIFFVPIVLFVVISCSKKEVKFEKTPKMSTYLLFLGIAEFESISEMMNAIEINVITHPGLTKFGKDALDFSKKSLSYCQTYFDIPYPLPKLDLIATPDFAAGAMENWGAISFREDLLLTFPGFTTKINEMIIKVVIAHEITHQWFGNYVSPSIWKYIWLNESFAEFFANKIVDHFYPDLKLWDHVVEQDISVAFLSDAYHETVPIEIKSQKKTSYNIKSVPIIYNKGGAILRMVENFVEDKFFQKGLQLYLNKHAYNVASSDDLWESLEKASNKPISKLMKTWVLQPGYPLITVNCDGNTLELSQERFTYLANDDKSLWLVPITILFITENNDQIERKFLLDKKTDSITVDFNFSTFKVNFDVTGFYRVNYALTDLQNLGTLVSQSKLSTLDSWNLENDLFALFKAEKLDLEYYLEFIQNYKSISLYTAIPSISEHLVEIYLLASGKSKQAITNQGVIFHERILESIHYTPQENEPFSISIMRNLLILHASYLGSPKAIKFALEQFEIIKSGKEINPDIINAVYSIAARQGNDLNWFLNRLEKAQNEVEIITLGNVLGEFSNPEIIDEVLNEVVFTKIPMRNRSGIIWRLCKNPNSIKKMWKFFIANLDNIGKLHESIQERVINNVVSYSVDEETKQDMQKFFTEFNKTNELAKITTEKSFETLEINLRLKKRLK